MNILASPPRPGSFSVSQKALAFVKTTPASAWGTGVHLSRWWLKTLVGWRWEIRLIRASSLSCRIYPTLGEHTTKECSIRVLINLFWWNLCRKICMCEHLSHLLPPGAPLSQQLTFNFCYFLNQIPQLVLTDACDEPACFHFGIKATL